MDPATQFKICPRCKGPSALSAEFCAKCGRRYQTTGPERMKVGLAVLVLSCFLATTIGVSATLMATRQREQPKPMINPLPRTAQPQPTVAVQQQPVQAPFTNEPPAAYPQAISPRQQVEREAVQPQIPPAPQMSGYAQQPQPSYQQDPQEQFREQIERARRTPRRARQTAQPLAQPQADNADFDKYLKWLRYVENERSGLRAQGETVAFQQIQGHINAEITMKKRDRIVNPRLADPRIENWRSQNIQMLNNTVRAVQAFRANVIQSRRNLLVPADCKGIDAYYMKALDQEVETTAALMGAMANGNEGAIRSIGSRGVGSIDMNLGMANKELKKAYESRSLNQLFFIETGGNASMLGGLTGIGGKR